MINVVRRRLGSWGNKYVSLGGRIVLINAVLNVIPIFYLSYMKMPLKVWKELVKIQRTFLWAGLAKTNKTCWVRWDVICRPKKEGGLGIKDLRLVNMSLLAKWRWRLLMGEDDAWKSVVKAKYGSSAIGKAELDVSTFGNGCSHWWRDLCNLDKGVNWFTQVVTKKVGRGNSTLFWKDIWVGNQTLEQQFPRLYSISIQQEEVVGNMGMWTNGVWRWELRWRREFFIWEENVVTQLVEILNDITLLEEEDSWMWRPNVGDGFSVKSLYETLDALILPRPVADSLEVFSFRTIWKAAVPSKVSAFAWQSFLNRIPIKDNLLRRGILCVEEVTCPACGGQGESTRHLILHCRFASLVWYAVCRWLGVVVVLPADVMMSYGILVGSGRNKRIREGFAIVWLALAWVLWRTRNDRVFNNGAGTVEEAVDQIQRLSWQWYLNRMAKASCLLYEWVWEPGECMMRGV
jgi:mannosylglycoprotein endo-beta-mannosidase